MTSKPEVLFLAHRIPYPPDKGDKIRSWRLFRHLTERHAVHLACFVDDQRDFEHTDYLRDLCASAAFVRLDPRLARLKSLAGLVTGEPLSFPYYRDRKMTKAVTTIRARPLAAEVVFSSSMAPYIEEPYPERRRIIDFCDADSEKWLQYSQETSGPLGWTYKREGHQLALAETRIANWADTSFAITADEASIFNQRANMHRTVGWWSNGVDTKYYDPAAQFGEIPTPCDVVFVGAMDYRANVDAVLRFVETVWPKIRKAAPDASFAIVGANPVQPIKTLDGKHGVTVTGRVDDVRPWLKQAKVNIAPLQVARGIQNKVLEAMAMGLPVVATPEAVTGIDAEDGADIVIASDADAVADAVVELLNNEGERKRLGKAARVKILANYDWGEQLRRFDEAFKDIPGDYSAESSALSSKIASSA